MSPRRWFTGYVVLVALITGAYVLETTLRPALWITLGVVSVAAVLLGIRVNHPRHRAPWLLVALALLLLLAGETRYLVQTQILHQSSPFPSASDALYLAVYPVLITGLLLLPRSAMRQDRGDVLDALVLAAGIGLLAWIFVIAPFLQATELTTLQRLASVAYPVFDLVFLVVLARMAGSALRTPAGALLLLGVVALLVTDVFYGLAQVAGSWRQTSGYLDVGWLVVKAAWGAAALHPSMASLTEPRVLPETRVTATRLAVLTAAAMIPPAVLLIEAARGTEVDAVPIATLSTVVFLLVLVRLAGVVRSYRHATERERSLRQAGASLVAATDVGTVRAVVLAAVARMFPAGDGHAAALPIHEQRPRHNGHQPEPVDPEVPDTGPTRFVPTNAISHAQLQHLRAFEIAVACPLPVTRRTSDGLTGTLLVAADDEKLGELRGTIEALAAQAALAIDRISLNAEVARREGEQYFRALVQNANDVILIVDDDGTIRYASPSVAALFPDEEVLGRPVPEFVVESHRHLAWQAIERVRRGQATPEPGDWTVIRQDGTAREVEVAFRDLREDPAVGGIVLTVRDVTEQRRLDRELTYLAYHDSLTGLPNRVRFAGQVRDATARALKRGTVAGVLFVDVDDFKMVNDTMGHEIGDRLLEVVGGRLAVVVGRGDSAARLGGDEFAVLVEDASSSSEVEQVADQIGAALAEPVVLGGSLLSTSASIGIATTADEDRNDELMRRADMALHIAKVAGKGRWRRYEPALHAAMVKRMEVRSALERALTRDEFSLAYQPVVHLPGERPAGLEALLRWDDPERGPVSPSEFIDVAEESGLILPIGDWILARALADAAQWPVAPPQQPYLSVNISVRQFRNPALVNTIRRELGASGFPPQRLQLEITESLLLRDDERVWSDLTRLRDLGIKVAIDDFGTGYSSLSYLRQVPIDVLKIDKTFIATMDGSTQQRALVETIIRLGQTLGLEVVAEGVARPRERDLLVAMGCPLGQGYLFAAPMSQDETMGWLREHAGRVR